MKGNLKNIIGMVIYCIITVVYIINIKISYKEIYENLEGWHDFHGSDAKYFVLLSIIMLVGCIYNARKIWKNEIMTHNHFIGVALVVLPIVFHNVAVSLQGNVETDLQYLMLRTFQGFDSVYVYLIIISIIGCGVMFYTDFWRKKNS